VNELDCRESSSSPKESMCACMVATGRASWGWGRPIINRQFIERNSSAALLLLLPPLRIVDLLMDDGEGGYGGVCVLTMAAVVTVSGT